MKTNALVTRFPVSSFASEAFADFERIFEMFGANQVYDERVYESAFKSDETKTHYSLSIDLPGVKREEIKLQIADGILNIAAERKHANKEVYFFKRSFTLPKNTELEKIEAHYEDGVLELIMPKMTVAKPLEIAVQGPKKNLLSSFLNGKNDKESEESKESAS